MGVKEEAKKELDRVELIIKNLQMIDSKGEEILTLINSYHEDAKHFYEKEKYLQAFEASVICWAYADAGLHLKVFEIPKDLKKFFTV
jgi:hypothetical protein